jgi:hypothetical protein
MIDFIFITRRIVAYYLLLIANDTFRSVRSDDDSFCIFGKNTAEDINVVVIGTGAIKAAQPNPSN